MIRIYQDLLLKDGLKSMINQKKITVLVVEGDITLEGNNDANKRNKIMHLKNNAPFINCILKINGIQIDNTEDLDVVMSIYNLLKYS